MNGDVYVIMCPYRDCDILCAFKACFVIKSVEATDLPLRPSPHRHGLPCHIKALFLHFLICSIKDNDHIGDLLDVNTDDLYFFWGGILFMMQL